MPILVHLADEKDAAKIKRNGVKIGKHQRGIFCMPVLQNFYLSHQWLRELKRRGVKTFVGVYFKIDRNIKVFAGKYNTDHRYIALGEAIREIQTMDDPLGYEIIIDRKIEAKEIKKIKNLPQNVGWRYKPEANGTRPCSCDYCIKSAIKANSIRKKYGPAEKQVRYNDLLKRLSEEKDEYEVEHLLCFVRSKKRRGDPMELAPLLERESVYIDQNVALTLKVFRHKNSRLILETLLQKPDDNTREIAAGSLLALYDQDVRQYLENLDDAAIRLAVQEWERVGK